MDIEPVTPKTWLYLLISGVLVIVLGGGTFYYFSKKSRTYLSNQSSTSKNAHRITITTLPDKKTDSKAGFRAQAEDEISPTIKPSSQLEALVSSLTTSSEEIANLANTLDSLDLSKDEIFPEINK